MVPSHLADRVVPVRTKVSSVSPPPFPDRVRPQAPVGSVLLPLLDCIDSLQTPMGSMAPKQDEPGLIRLVVGLLGSDGIHGSLGNGLRGGAAAHVARRTQRFALRRSLDLFGEALREATVF
jgi:hypothetical protein